jgi:2-oxoisovalerate dehydrogenase E1 component
MPIKAKVKANSNIPKSDVDIKVLLKAYELMQTARHMADLYDEEKAFAGKYVHSTSRGHEAIQLAAAFHLTENDYASPYYRDECLLLGIGMKPRELMLQLMAKRDDPFTGGRSYYSHPALRRKGMPTIPHQSSATGMQAIPATGMAHGIQYLEGRKLLKAGGKLKPVVLCSFGDGSITEGEVSEAFQMAVLKSLSIIYLVQDNDWGISATGAEMRAMDAYDFAAGFKGMHRIRIRGQYFEGSYMGMKEAFQHVRNRRGPVLVHAECPLLGHHTSGVRREWYRSEEDLNKHDKADPLPRLRFRLEQLGIEKGKLNNIVKRTGKLVKRDFEFSRNSPDPDIEKATQYEFAPGTVTRERGVRSPEKGEKVMMVDSALHGIDEILKEHPEALFYGQDVGRKLGGVFREAALLAQKYGDDRIFNTPIQEAYIVGSTAGMSAVGAKAIVEVQFGDYIWPGLNQLVEELSKSCFLTQGKFPIASVIRVPVGAYGGGGPYHSGSIESTLLTIKGIKIAYPSNAADMKGLMKSAFLDPNPVLMLEHKGLYWSKVEGTEGAKSIEPDKDYVIPFGKGRIELEADKSKIEKGESLLIISYGMGVHWSANAAKDFEGMVEILDLRTLYPLDFELIEERVQIHGKTLIVTEEPVMNSFAESLAGRISSECFEYLDGPVRILGAKNVPAIPLNVDLEKEILPNEKRVNQGIEELLKY